MTDDGFSWEVFSATVSGWYQQSLPEIQHWVGMAILSLLAASFVFALVDSGKRFGSKRFGKKPRKERKH